MFALVAPELAYVMGLSTVLMHTVCEVVLEADVREMVLFALTEIVPERV